MAERTVITNGIQIGVEATPGVAVPADKKLLSAAINLSGAGDVQVIRGSGSKFPAIAALGKDFAEGDLEGAPTYTELAYLLSGLLGDPVISTPGGATNARLWTWPIRVSAPQEGKTFTVEQGSSVAAERTTGAVISGLSLDYTRDELSLGGSVLARAFETGATLTAAPTEIPLVPMLPKEVDVFLDDTVGAIGTTKLLRALAASWDISDRFGALWPLNSALPSYAATFETEPSSEIGLTLAADAVGMGLYDVLRAGSTRFLRIQAQSGTEIEAGFPYRFRFDGAVKVTDVPDFSDEDGLYAVGWQFGLFSGFGADLAGEITLQTSLLAL